MAETPTNLAEQALANLVNQFARPLDFLRELVQNSIDAGSPRVEVSIAYDEPDDPAETGVLRVHVDDFGEGMDEEVIDNQLTRLFASTKENDLTKIGKFGIGFTSIFAILPEAVLLRTGRHGETWELLFHKDRSFDKVRIDEPVDGTKITLFKRMQRSEVERFIREARWILTYWCEHSDTPITFWDRTNEADADEAPEEDPFAAFDAPTEGVLDTGGPEAINQPLELVADLSHRQTEPGIEVVVGYTASPRFGYYNGGLTLLNTTNVETLGSYADRLGHLSFKVKSDALEHTLTRDNVLQDSHWDRAMNLVHAAAIQLRQKLVERTAKAVENDENLALWHAYLAAECRVDDSGWLLQPPASMAGLFRDHRGSGISMKQVLDQEREVGAVLYDPGKGGLQEALQAEEVLLLEDLGDTRDLLAAAERIGTFASGPSRRQIAADDLFVLPELVPETLWSAQETALMEVTADLLTKSVGRRLVLRLGDFGGPERGRKDVLALDGPKDGGVFQRPGTPWFRLPAIVNWRALLVNRHHPFFQAQLLGGVEDLELAGYALAQALLHVEGVEGERAYRGLLEVAMKRLEARA